MRILGRWALWTLLALAVLIGILRATAIRWWRVPSDDPYLEASVAPSLRGGDWVLLWRLTPPALGSLALCPEPKHPERMTVGRLIGERRDRVLVEGSKLTVNQRVAPTEGDCAEDVFTVVPPQGGAEVELSCSLEVASAVTHQRGNAPANAEVPKLEVQIGDGEVALVSDNRRYPYDSRDFGNVVRETCKETVFFRLIGPKGFFDTATRFTYIR
jgi:signal peptidase I